jgi:hypothetical protein
MSLWKHEWPETLNSQTFADPTAYFVALINLLPNGTFRAPKVITGPLAAITYVMRAAFKLEAHLQCFRDPTVSLEKAVRQLSCWFIEEGAATPWLYVRTMQHLATTAVLNSPEMPYAVWTDATFTKLRFRGNLVDFDKLILMFRKIQDKMHQIYKEDLCMGMDIKLEYDPHDIVDDLSDTTPGYSFINDPHNKAFKHKESVLFRAIHNNEKVLNQFVSRLDDKPVWKRNALAKWLRNLAQLEMLCLLCAVFLTGGPGRGTELHTMTFCNTMNGQRNLFSLGQYIGIVKRYLKTSAITGFDRLIPSGFDAFTADMLIHVMVILRPFAIAAAGICFDNNPEILTFYEQSMWTNYGKPFVTEDMTRVMREFSNAFVGVSIGMRDWRQIYVAFHRKLLGDPFALVDSIRGHQKVNAQQMGHGPAIERLFYGNTTASFLGYEDAILALLESSCQWQALCQIIPGAVSLVILSFPPPETIC